MNACNKALFVVVRDGRLGAIFASALTRTARFRPTANTNRGTARSDILVPAQPGVPERSKAQESWRLPIDLGLGVHMLGFSLTDRAGKHSLGSASTSLAVSAPALLIVNRAIGDLLVQRGQALDLSIPNDTLISGDFQALHFKTILINQAGQEQALPTWLKFDSLSARFSGRSGKDAPSSMHIRLTAKDSSDQEASIGFVIKLESKSALPNRDLRQILAVKSIKTLPQMQERGLVDTPQHDDALAAALAIDLQMPESQDKVNGINIRQYSAQLSSQLLQVQQRFQQDGAATQGHLARLQQPIAKSAR